MTEPLLSCLLRQHDTAWTLTRYHLDGLTTEACLWQPGGHGPHVHPQEDGRWLADWPTRESYDIGPPSIAWVTWHMGFWWSMVLDHSFGPGELAREDVEWPGDADAVRTWLAGLQEAWQRTIDRLDRRTLEGHDHTRWPFRDRPFADVIAWVNVELTKNAAELGYARFLYASRG